MPYFEALQLLKDANLVVVIGSDDAQYTASKIYPCVLAQKALVAVVHEASSVGPLLTRLRAGEVVTFSPSAAALAAATDACVESVERLFDAGLAPPPTDWAAFEPFTAREMTRRQCALFDAVVGN